MQITTDIKNLRKNDGKSITALTFSYYNNRGCWTARRRDTEQWIAVEFDTAFEISAIQLQNRKSATQWVKTYELTYSIDGKNWKTYTNDDGDTVIYKI